MTFSEDYPALYRSGVNESMLLDDDLKQLKMSVVTNESVLELFKFMNANSCVLFTR